jgi:proline iminopeptidase
MFYPPIMPFKITYLNVSGGHRLYIEQVGDPLGIPILFLHGGPGSGLDKNHRQFFDPKKFHVILFDQRGCGQSTPYGELKQNKTDTLISDIEMIREHFQIPTWHVFGGSWGSFLALSYAEKHPAKVLSLILRGLFLGRKEELQFFYQKGASFIYPENYKEFISILDEEEKKDVVLSFYERLQSHDEKIVNEAAKHWSFWEASCLKLINTKNTIEAFAKPSRLVSLAKLETHYFVHGCFIKPNQLLEEAYILKDIPITVVHGRYDLICPIENAFLLKDKCPHMKLHVAKSSGHSALEEEILNQLHVALDLIK